MTSQRNHTPARLLIATAILGTSVALTVPAPASAATSTVYAQTRPTPARQAPIADTRMRPAQAGSIISSRRVADLTAQQVAAELQGEVESDLVRHGVTAYQVVYRTTNSAGEPTTASQFLVLPKTVGRHLPTVAWLHGTIAYRKDTASENPGSSDRLAAYLLASTGRAVSAPDYVGLGAGEGFHPYGDPRATVAATVDGLRAARAFAHRNGRELDREVQVSGFSQGGPATMLVGRALQEEGADQYFRLGALAPVAGPFHLSAFEAAAADDKIDKSGLYLAYFATAWNKTYGLYSSPSEAFRAPYDQIVEELFDGYHTTEQIAGALPPASKDLFTSDFLDRIRTPSGVLKQRLHALDTTCDWKPNVPVSLFHARGDKDVDASHPAYCAQQLKDNGADFRLTDVGDHDHNNSVEQALPRIVRFFDETADAD
ncbi:MULTISPECIES: lipase family protein [unclassified Streptomyces]|uniref:lipase family protein n=1 Tax=unclassified Streptomyces TaxID=2593676 RepID=UPI002251A5B7|nr:MULTISPECIES: lipase family protein [unclassified Streptomyces]MCX4399085.1 lipase family protein [Streptomyces sp. NBC_01767]WSP51352.1 lipase family protein [Streptomyces sp. NBC_01243]